MHLWIWGLIRTKLTVRCSAIQPTWQGCPMSSQKILSRLTLMEVSNEQVISDYLVCCFIGAVCIHLLSNIWQIFFQTFAQQPAHLSNHKVFNYIRSSRSGQIDHQVFHHRNLQRGQSTKLSQQLHDLLDSSTSPRWHSWDADVLQEAWEGGWRHEVPPSWAWLADRWWWWSNDANWSRCGGKVMTTKRMRQIGYKAVKIVIVQQILEFV